MIKRAHIHQFLAVVDTGSFSRGAARIGITQPSLSHGIAELERLVGSRLLERDRKQIRLTSAGASMLPIARDLYRNFRTLDCLQHPKPASSATLKIGILRTIGTATYKKLLAGLPDTIAIEVVDGNNAELRSLLSAGKARAVVTILGSTEHRYSAAAIHSEPYRMMVPATADLARRQTISATELAGETMIARRSCEVLQETSRFFTSRGVRPHFAYRSDNDDRCLALVAAGRGITTAPLSMAVDGIVPLEVLDYNLMRTIGVVGDSDWIRSAEGRAVRQAVAQAFGA